MRLDLIDEFRVDLFPYVAGRGHPRLFDDDPKSYQLDPVSSTAWSNGSVGQHYRRHRGQVLRNKFGEPEREPRGSAGRRQVS